MPRRSERSRRLGADYFLGGYRLAEQGQAQHEVLQGNKSIIELLRARVPRLEQAAVCVAAEAGRGRDVQ